MDEIVEREIKRYLKEHAYNAALEHELRCEVAQWKQARLAEIDALTRSMMH